MYAYTCRASVAHLWRICGGGWFEVGNAWVVQQVVVDGGDTEVLHTCHDAKTRLHRHKCRAYFEDMTVCHLLLLCLCISFAAQGNAQNGADGALEFFPPTRVGFVDQIIDHFTYDSTDTFRQKYMVYDKFWSPRRGPVFFYFGNEGGIEDFYNNSGAMFEYAPQFDALLVFLEHRYYGTSQPFQDNENLRYLTIEQALADATVFLSQKTSELGCDADTEACKVIMFGGSYGGMLAAWHRLKYPHLSAGALAMSAPVDLYPGENKEKAFYDATIDVFSKYGKSPRCGEGIAEGMAKAEMATFQELTQAFQTCRPVQSKSDVEKLMFYLKGAFATLAMLDYPYPTTFVTPMPGNPVEVACARMEEKYARAEILSGLNDAMNVFVNYTGQLKCHNITMELVGSGGVGEKTTYRHHFSLQQDPSLGSIYRTWNYQACTELILEPLTSDGDGFYVENKDQIAEVEASCRRRYRNVVTRKMWMLQAFGSGKDIVKHTTNMIFSDGDKDPWYVGGVPMNQTSPDKSVFHLFITSSAHHQDLRFSDERDSDSLKQARAIERHNIGKWLAAA
jgi:dipeptidyl-peptidase II